MLAEEFENIKAKSDIQNGLRAVDNSYTTSYTYDTNSNLLSATDAFGKTTDYVYDTMNRISKVNFEGLIFNYTYDPTSNNIKSITYPNGIKSDFNYDILNRITEYTASNGGSKYIDESFKFDNNSNITEKITDGNKETYGYDSFGRLISILDSVSGQNVAMEYDIRSNITKETALNPLESSYKVGTYTWNSLGFATSFEDEKGVKYSYNYTSKGLRTQKITENSYVNYFYTKGGILNAQEVDGMKMSYINGHQTLAKVQDGKIYYYIYNSHGDVIKLVDKNGTVVNEYSYDVWGITKTIKSETYNDLRYTGQIYDEESGNYYLRARYYNPQIKRFISRDGYEGTLDNPISQNRYIYCLNSPLIYSDPSGNDAEDIGRHLDGKEINLSIHDFLDTIGMADMGVPGSPADLADVVNALLYLIEGDEENMYLSFLAVVNDGVTLAKHADEISDAYKQAVNAVQGMSNLNPNKIRFSQSSVNGSQEIIESMAKNGWVGDPIDVVKMADGGLTTIDNTRVVAARAAGIDVQAVVHNADDLLPESLIERFTTKQGVPTTWGEAIELRIGKQNSGFRINNPYGSFEMEKIK